MRIVTRVGVNGMPAEDAARARRGWGWFLALGVVQIVAGILAVVFEASATFASVMALGVLLLVAAGAQTALAFWARNWGGFFLFLLLGVLYAVTGALTLQYPLAAAEGLTLMLAAVLLVGGVIRIVVALAEPIPSRGWVLGNGVIALLLGVAIWQQWPESGLWVIGLFVGIELIVNGTVWSLLAVRVRERTAAAKRSWPRTSPGGPATSSFFLED